MEWVGARMGVEAAEGRGKSGEWDGDGHREGEKEESTLARLDFKGKRV